MRPTVHNYRSRRTWRNVVPVLPACLLPVALMGVTVKPVVDYTGLTQRLEAAQERAERARDVREFLAAFGDEGPPIEDYRRMLAALAGRLPGAFEPTEFYEAALSAAASLGLALEAIVPGSEQDLGHAIGARSVHERRATLKGRARSAALPSFLAALHREGQPVCVHGCTLRALESEPGVFDFNLDLGVFYLAPPTDSDDEFDEDS